MQKVKKRRSDRDEKQHEKMELISNFMQKKAFF